MNGVRDLNLAQDAGKAGGGTGLPPVSRWVPVGCLSLVLAVTFLTYLDTLWFQFVHDDEYQILGNAFLRSWRFLPRYFSADVWAFRHPDIPGNFYRPLFLLWLRFNYVLFGTNPWGWHLTTVLAHLGATLCVFFLARRLLADWVAALYASLIFGLHPIHIEGAAWVSGVPEPLLAVLIIPSYLCFLRSQEKTVRSGAWLIASLGLYSLAMLMKETAVILPALIFASCWVGWKSATHGWFENWPRRLKDSFWSAAPYLGLTAPYFVARYLVLKGFQHPSVNLPFVTTISTWPSLLWLYLRHVFWPVGLHPFYDLTYVVHPGLRNAVLPAVPVALAILLLAWWAKRSVQVALASLWLVLPILPTLNVQIFGNGFFAHDRYLYLPSAGISILAALALRRLKTGKSRLLGQPALQVALLLVIACALGQSTAAQSGYYATHATYYANSYAVAPDNDAAKTNLAGLLGEQGHYAEAVDIYLEVLKRNPDPGFVVYDLGYAYYQMGKLEEAEYYLTQAAESMPFPAAAYFCLGLTQFKMGHLEDAVRNLRRAVAISRYTDNYHFALGMVLKTQGNLPGALQEFQAELALNPRHSEARKQSTEIEEALRPRLTPGSTLPDSSRAPDSRKP